MLGTELIRKSGIKYPDIDYQEVIAVVSVYVSLPTVRRVQEFVAQISNLPGDFDLVSGKYILDAKSLMGVLSLDLSRPVKLNIEQDTAETMRAIKRFETTAPK